MARTKQAKTRRKVIGTQEYINHDTGEIVEMQVIQEDVPEKDSGFYKLYMRDFVRTLELIANKKEKVCYWIIDHLNKDNMLIYTYHQIADEIGVSYDTVAATVKILLDADFLRKHHVGVYIVNPNIIFKGSHNRRLNILHTYSTSESGDKGADAELRLKNLDETIASLQKKRDTLAKQCEFLNKDNNGDQSTGQQSNGNNAEVD